MHIKNIFFFCILEAEVIRLQIELQKKSKTSMKINFHLEEIDINRMIEYRMQN